MSDIRSKVEGISLSVTQAQKILDLHLADKARPVLSVTELPKPDFSYRSISKVYRLDVDNPPEKVGSSYRVTLELPEGDIPTSSAYGPNRLREIAELINRIAERDDIGVRPSVLSLDTSCTHVPYSYLLQPILFPAKLVSDDSTFRNMALPELNALGLPDGAVGSVELSMGRTIAAYHDIVGTKFGPPGAQAETWKASFASMLGALLSDAEANAPALPAAALQKCLKDTCESGLFDDVETPKLVLFPTDEEDTLVAVADEPEPVPLLIGMRARLDYALWADPLFEVDFMPTRTKETFVVGYEQHEKDAGREGDLQARIDAPIAYSKRVWYELFFHLFILLGDGANKAESKEQALESAQACAKLIIDSAPDE
ncbi:hypothetical protein FISHEDRAFT_56020 [Fistulina hepatica ATCC 64428]|uniref:Aminoglycoside phosphotransferase domain-containing protein n=1 Tax=Fistulina hepatica ATCC 64428 TaxID=1128425 RepID=A0A0D7AKJ7_9AGAR|nr:hypothetical protein FISHEDRAFT_56020 [Fistulina hepatica ATCC 64428]